MITCTVKKWPSDAVTQLVLERQPRSVLHRVLGFATEVGLSITLTDIGLTKLPKEVLQKIAVRATAENKTIHNESFEVRLDMIANAIMAADAIGRAWKKEHRPK
jgi:glycerol dehydrogenase